MLYMHFTEFLIVYETYRCSRIIAPATGEGWFNIADLDKRPLIFSFYFLCQALMETVTTG